MLLRHLYNSYIAGPLIFPNSAEATEYDDTPYRIIREVCYVLDDVE